MNNQNNAQYEYARTQFQFYRSYFDYIYSFDNPFIRLRMYEVIMEYALYRAEPTFSGDDDKPVELFWMLIKPGLELAWKNYDKCSRKRDEAK